MKIFQKDIHDTIRPLSFYNEQKGRFRFVGSCMVHKGDLKIVSQILKNIEKSNKEIKFKAPLVVTAPTYNIIDELKDEETGRFLQKYSGFEFNDENQKTRPELNTKI